LVDHPSGEQVHHHDVVHFALTEIGRLIADGQGDDLRRRLQDRLHEIQGRRRPPECSPFDSGAFPYQKP